MWPKQARNSNLLVLRLQEIASEKESGKPEQMDAATQNIKAFQMMMRVVGFEESSKDSLKVRGIILVLHLRT